MIANDRNNSNYKIHVFLALYLVYSVFFLFELSYKVANMSKYSCEALFAQLVCVLAVRHRISRCVVSVDQWLKK